MIIRTHPSLNEATGKRGGPRATIRAALAEHLHQAEEEEEEEGGGEEGEGEEGEEPATGGIDDFKAFIVAIFLFFFSTVLSIIVDATNAKAQETVI